MLKYKLGSLLFLAPFFLLAQTPKSLLFSESWQLAENPSQIYYECNGYVDEHGLLIGSFTCKIRDVDIVIKEYYYKDNILNGKVKEYFPSGKLKVDAEYQMGKPINDWIEYDEKGKIIFKKTYNEKSLVVQDYFQEKSPYEKLLDTKAIENEPPIYTTDCIKLKVPQQQWSCSEEKLLAYVSNPPIPPSYKNNATYTGKEISCLLKFKINKQGIVDAAEIILSSGDDFLDELAVAHVLNMVPWEAAKEKGQPIDYWQDAQIIFSF